jgi:hypothetical protein
MRSPDLLSGEGLRRTKQLSSRKPSTLIEHEGKAIVGCYQVVDGGMVGR